MKNIGTIIILISSGFDNKMTIKVKYFDYKILKIKNQNYFELRSIPPNFQIQSSQIESSSVPNFSQF